MGQNSVNKIETISYKSIENCRRILLGLFNREGVVGPTQIERKLNFLSTAVNIQKGAWLSVICIKHKGEKYCVGFTLKTIKVLHKTTILLITPIKDYTRETLNISLKVIEFHKVSSS